MELIKKGIGKPEITSRRMKARNFMKHVRIANATTGHEQEAHIQKAKKFAERYKDILKK